MATSTNGRRARRTRSAILAAAGAAFVVSSLFAAPIAAARGLSPTQANQYWACIDNAESISVPCHNESAVRKSCCESVGGTYLELPSGSNSCYIPEPVSHPGRTAAGRVPITDASRV